MKWTEKKIIMDPKTKLRPARVCYEDVILKLLILNVINTIGRGVFKILTKM